MSNCTQCHVLGKTIASDRCLVCHTEIRSRLEAGSGLHGRNKYQQCVDCHKEHHGREFAMRKIDTKSFDHALTGYMLKGKHAPVDCAKCHKEEMIRSVDIAKKEGGFKAHTYLGLSTDCGACHRDVHAGQLPARCEQCHTTEGWKPAPGFSHSSARYPLTGKHQTVECAACHKKTLEQGTVVQYTHIEFSTCSSCHLDPHNGKFVQSCQSCHSTSAWNEGPAKSFDHSLTRFALKGKHTSVKCVQCHTEIEKKGKPVAGRYAVTKFALCGDCHEDAHAGQFAHRADRGKCEACHTEERFIPSRYSVADHNTSRFVLTGAHIATACTGCHTPGAVKAKNTHLFHWKGEIRCATCHADVHKSEFQSEPKKECEGCHATRAWNALEFSHEKTKFSLRGKHAQIECSKCHQKIETGLAGERVKFRGVALQCSSCHKDEHEGQFTADAPTECSRCHTDASWTITNFNHTLLSRYELTGKHSNVSCEKCHRPTTIHSRTVARYKPLGTACIDCHSSDELREKK